jgi:hypothetical protein
LLSVSCFVGVTLGSAWAFADESEPERLFREARTAMLEGHFDEACPKLVESQRLEPRVGTLLNLAACHERQGKIASAWREYRQAQEGAESEGQPDRASFAEVRVAVIQDRVPRLRVALSGDGEGARVTLDGSELSRGALGTELPVDPGLHVVEAKTAGGPLFQERIELREGEHRTLTVVLAPALHEKPAWAPAVIEPAAPPKEKTSGGRLIFEPGIYVAAVRGLGGDQPFPAPELAERLVIERIGSGERTNCLMQTGCAYGPPRASWAAATGLNLFGGWAFSDHVQIGFRLLVGAMFSGGVIVALGPQASFRPTRALTLGVFGAAGSATVSSRIALTPPPGFVASETESDVERRVGALGGGLDLSLRIAELERGEIVVNATPFFLGGISESVLGLPIGIAYRFR